MTYFLTWIMPALFIALAVGVVWMWESIRRLPARRWHTPVWGDHQLYLREGYRPVDSERADAMRGGR